jgi:hypothetical protein
MPPAIDTLRSHQYTAPSSFGFRINASLRRSADGGSKEHAKQDDSFPRDVIHHRKALTMHYFV